MLHPKTMHSGWGHCKSILYPKVNTLSKDYAQWFGVTVKVVGITLSQSGWGHCKKISAGCGSVPE